jgi:hypothetical protein
MKEKASKKKWERPIFLDINPFPEALGHCVFGSTADPGAGTCHTGQDTGAGNNCNSGANTSVHSHACATGGNTSVCTFGSIV